MPSEDMQPEESEEVDGNQKDAALRMRRAIVAELKTGKFGWSDLIAWSVFGLLWGSLVWFVVGLVLSCIRYRY